MANIASSKKDARRSAVRAVRNRSIRSAVKTKVTRLRRALTDRGEAAEQVPQLAVTAVAALDRAAAKGVLHRNNAARRKSRLMKRLGAVAAAPQPASEPTRRARPAAAAAAKPAKAKTTRRK
jgi:small subunit ribosomal protein S20